MYPFILKYKQVIINALLFIFIILAIFNFHKDFFLGAASCIALITLGESIGNLKREKYMNNVNEEEIKVINS